MGEQTMAQLGFGASRTHSLTTAMGISLLPQEANLLPVYYLTEICALDRHLRCVISTRSTFRSEKISAKRSVGKGKQITSLMVHLQPGLCSIVPVGGIRPSDTVYWPCDAFARLPDFVLHSWSSDRVKRQ
jgi:hypothetical protein